MAQISIRFYNDREVRAAWDKKNFKVPKSKFQSAWHFEMIPSKTTTREVTHELFFYHSPPKWLASPADWQGNSQLASRTNRLQTLSR